MTNKFDSILMNIKNELSGLSSTEVREVLERLVNAEEGAEVSALKTIDGIVTDIFFFCRDVVENTGHVDPGDLLYPQYWEDLSVGIRDFFIDNDPYALNYQYYEDRVDSFEDKIFDYTNDIVIVQKDFASKLILETRLRDVVKKDSDCRLIQYRIEGYVSEMQDVHCEGAAQFVNYLFGTAQKAINASRTLLK